MTVTAADGVALGAWRFEPDGPPRARVVTAPAMAVPQSFYGAFDGSRMLHAAYPPAAVDDRLLAPGAIGWSG